MTQTKGTSSAHSDFFAFFLFGLGGGFPIPEGPTDGEREGSVREAESQRERMTRELKRAA